MSSHNSASDYSGMKWKCRTGRWWEDQVGSRHAQLVSRLVLLFFKLCSLPVVHFLLTLVTSVTKQYKFGTSASWEGNHRSGVALAMCHTQ